jgi:FtsP/CotA-like multicopper oxidase with cupredoxin domain
MKISRRGFLAGSAALALPGIAQAEVPTITIGTRILEVNGKAAKVFGITGPDGKQGLQMVFGERFLFNLKNDLDEETAIHWHGLTPPTAQDGVPMLSANALKPGEIRDYDFENRKAGTHWMHSHLGLQEQRLLAAPLIVRETAKPFFDEQEHVILLHDFTFRDPQEILDGLKGGSGHMMKGMPGMVMGSDIMFDAMLANDRTLNDPEIVRAEPGGNLHLRIINGCAATNMWIDLGTLEGTLVAVDGNSVLPLKASRIPLAIAQRADIRLKLPAGSGSWPILFQAEGDTLRSGIIVQAGTGHIEKLADRGTAGAALDVEMEAKLQSLAQVLDEPVSHSELVTLTGDDQTYSWGFNGRPMMMHEVLFRVREGERVELTLHNLTGMAHPMHLHGHYFKVVGLGATRIKGAVRDTILVLPDTSVTLQFDANNPGNWAFHCHHLYHMNSGMMAAMAYQGAA